MAHLYAYHKQYEKHEKLDWSESFSEDSISEEMFQNIKSICMLSGARCQSLQSFISLEELVVYPFYDADMPALPPSLKYLIFASEYNRQVILPPDLKLFEIDMPIFNVDPQLKFLLPNSLRIFKTNLQRYIFSDILPESLDTLVNTASSISEHNAKIILRHYKITYYENRGMTFDRYVSIDGIVVHHIDKNRHNTELKKSGLVDFIYDD